ncbi:MAG: 2-octaprenylphenol hydroxylase [Paraglaciecola sp.]|jgi:2-octaprenylphenol hydroxylase
MQSYDVVIVGGGMVGLVLALALKDSGLSVAVIDAEYGDKPLGEQPALRVSALSLASENILRRLGVWDDIDRQRRLAYEHMSVWDKDSFGKIQFSHTDVHQAQLGHIIENQSLRGSLWRKAASLTHIELIAPKRITKLVFGQQESFITLDDESMLSARLVVGADGANSYVRQQAGLPLTFWDYDHRAIVATIKTALPHQNTARQIFTPTGPLAFLPLWDEHLCSIVWSQDEPEAQRLLALSPDEFNKALSASFDSCLGLCELVSERQSYPLKMRYARNWVCDRVALVGDAAHTIHPLAGQGANLGLLDAAALAEQLSVLAEQGKDIGLHRNLRPYERWRKTEAVKMIATMEGFKRIFAGDNALKKLLRDTALSTVNKLPKAKQTIIQQAMGLGGELPRLARSSNEG